MPRRSSSERPERLAGENENENEKKKKKKAEPSPLEARGPHHLQLKNFITPTIFYHH